MAEGKNVGDPQKSAETIDSTTETFRASGSWPTRAGAEGAPAPADGRGLEAASRQESQLEEQDPGSLMAGGCRDDTVRIWEVATLTETYRLKNAGYAVAFTGDGKMLLAATAGGSAQWWDFRADTKRSVPEYSGLAQVTSVDLSSDRRVAALGRSDGAIQLLEIDSGTILGTCREHSDAVLALTFAPGGTRFASGSRDKTIRIWDVKAPGKSLQTCAEHNGAVGGLAIARDGRTMVSGCDAHTIKFWDMRHLGKSLASISWQHQSAIRTLALSPDNRAAGNWPA